MKINSKYIHILTREGELPQDALEKFPIEDPTTSKRFLFYSGIYLVFLSIILGIAFFAFGGRAGDFRIRGLILVFLLIQLFASPLIYIIIKAGMSLYSLRKNHQITEAKIICKLQGIYSAGQGAKRITTPISLIGIEFIPRNQDKVILFYTTTIESYKQVRINSSKLIAHSQKQPYIWTFIE